jgi:hypothetical protein
VILEATAVADALTPLRIGRIAPDRGYLFH